MFVLGLLIALALSTGAWFAAKKFDLHCEQKFGHKFFTKPYFYAVLGAVALLQSGVYVWNAANASVDGRFYGYDPLNGIVLAILAVAIFILIIVGNVRRTDVVYGLGGSLVQIGVFGILAYISLFLLIFAGVCLLFLLLGGNRGGLNLPPVEQHSRLPRKRRHH